MTLERDFRQVVHEMMLVSHGTTMRWNPSTRGGERETVLPPGEPKPLHEEWVLRWVNAWPSERPSVLQDAQEALNEARVQKDPPNVEAFVNRDSISWKRAIANSELSVAATARKFGVSRVTVYAYIERYRNEEAA